MKRYLNRTTTHVRAYAWSSILGAIGLASFTEPSRAHLIGDEAHEHSPPRYRWSVPPPTPSLLGSHADFQRVVLLAQAQPPATPRTPTGARTLPGTNGSSSMLAAFARFAPKVKTHSDANFLYVESDGLPVHKLMIGITAWQQQVPLPQPYLGHNAWRIPLHPTPAKSPASTRGRFLRGAIALAANGIPIFNPQNNRGEIAQELGELDQWGGHCGRADDYHYHAAPLHLQTVLGPGLPIACALDGYPIYGLTEPDGSAPEKLDALNGHERAGLGYHYHGSLKYPYVNGGFHGEVIEREGQVDPQPRTEPLRAAGAPLRGAQITGFTSTSGKDFSLEYKVNGELRYVNYRLNDDRSVKMNWVDGRGLVKSETYSPR